MPNYPYTFQLPPLSTQDIPNNGAVGEFLGISAGGVLDWLPVASGGGDMLKSENLSGLANYAIARTNIGLGTASTPTFANLTLTSPSLSSSAPVTISQTWGTTGTYTAFKVVANETATAATASNLLELWSGSTATLKLKVEKSGSLVLPIGSVLAPSLRFGTQPTNTGLYSSNGGTSPGIGLAIGGTAYLYTSDSSTGICLHSNWPLSWGTSTADSTPELQLRKDAANTLALRNGTAAQTFNVYGTSSASNANYARLALTCGLDGNATISTQALGTGTAGVLAFSPGNSERMRITTAGNVGIGTTAPTAPLDVVGGIRFNSIAIARSASIAALPNSTTGLYFGYDGTGDRAFFTSGTTNVSGVVSVRKPAIFDYSTFSFTRDGINADVFLNSSGNVGIGTTSPTSKLDVAGAVTAAGYYTATSGGVSLVANGLWQQGTGHLTLASGAILGWSGAANVNIDQPGDTRLLRDEAYHLALRNGTNGQKFSVYGTYPGAAWERFTITAPTSGNVLLGTYKGTGGIARGLEFQTDGVTRMTLSTTGGLAFNNNGTTDASSGIGAWYLTTTGVQIANTASFRWNGDVGISRNASGVVEINSTTAGTYRDLRVRSVIEQPPASITPALNGDLVVEATSNTTLTFKLKGTDGTVRTGTITLA